MTFQAYPPADIPDSLIEDTAEVPFTLIVPLPSTAQLPEKLAYKVALNNEVNEVALLKNICALVLFEVAFGGLVKLTTGGVGFVQFPFQSHPLSK